MLLNFITWPKIYIVNEVNIKKCNYAICHQEPISRSLQLPHIPVTAFSQTDLFLAEFISHSGPTGTSVTNCNHKHGLMLTCSHDVAMFT